jgi:hypothetical protein
MEKEVRAYILRIINLLLLLNWIKGETDRCEVFEEQVKRRK